MIPTTLEEKIDIADEALSARIDWAINQATWSKSLSHEELFATILTFIRGSKWLKLHHPRHAETIIWGVLRKLGVDAFDPLGSINRAMRPFDDIRGIVRKQAIEKGYITLLGLHGPDVANPWLFDFVGRHQKTAHMKTASAGFMLSDVGVLILAHEPLVITDTSTRDAIKTGFDELFGIMPEDEIVDQHEQVVSLYAERTGTTPEAVEDDYKKLALAA